MGARLLPQFYQYPNLSESADRVDGQLRGDKECPFSGVTKSGSLEEGAGKPCRECARKHETHPPRVKKKFRLVSNDFGFISAGVSNMAT